MIHFLNKKMKMIVMMMMKIQMMMKIKMKIMRKKMIKRKKKKLKTFWNIPNTCKIFLILKQKDFTFKIY
jgi:hypothetical protein